MGWSHNNLPASRWHYGYVSLVNDVMLLLIGWFFVALFLESNCQDDFRLLSLEGIMTADHLLCCSVLVQSFSFFSIVISSFLVELRLYCCFVADLLLYCCCVLLFDCCFAVRLLFCCSIAVLLLLLAAKVLLTSCHDGFPANCYRKTLLQLNIILFTLLPVNFVKDELCNSWTL